MTNAQRFAAKMLARDLYRAMPGAPPVPLGDDGWYWGDVEDNEHYQFCDIIAKRIVGWSGNVSGETETVG